LRAGCAAGFGGVGELLGTAKEGLLALSVGVGLGVLAELTTTETAVPIISGSLLVSLGE
jgi:hypothetical protein